MGKRLEIDKKVLKKIVWILLITAAIPLTLALVFGSANWYANKNCPHRSFTIDNCVLEGSRGKVDLEYNFPFIKYSFRLHDIDYAYFQEHWRNFESGLFIELYDQNDEYINETGFYLGKAYWRDFNNKNTGWLYFVTGKTMMPWRYNKIHKIKILYYLSNNKNPVYLGEYFETPEEDFFRWRGL